MMNTIVKICRILVGSLFIVSGLIKANDALGFSYKLIEYFDIFGMDFLNGAAVGIAIFICVTEVLLGVATLLGAKMKLVSWLLLILMVFFTILTLYSHITGKVTDCGCFGDAIKLTPYQSFMKDVILLVFVIPIVIWKNKITYNSQKDHFSIGVISLILITLFSILQLKWIFPIVFTVICLATAIGVERLREKSEWLIAGVIGLFSLVFTLHTYWHLPIKDYRIYRIGNNIQQERDNALPPIIESRFIYKHPDTGEQKTLSTNQLTEIDLNVWKFVDRTDEIVREGTQKVNDFNIERSSLNLTKEEEEKYLYTDAGRYERLLLFQENQAIDPEIYEKVMPEDVAYLKDQISRVDYVDFYLNHPKDVYFYITYDVSKANASVQEEAKKIADQIQAQGDVFIGITASGDEDVEAFRHEYGLAFDFYSMDEKALKTIIRSNPGLVKLKQGTIINKWHYNDFPAAKDL